MTKKYLYYFRVKNSNCLPSLITVWNRFIYDLHVPGLKSWSLDFHFENALIGFTYFLKPYAFPYKSKRLNIFKLGSLKGMALRIGRPIICFCITKDYFKKRIENIEKSILPLDFYSVQEGDHNGVKWYMLYINYNYQNLEKREPVCVAEYKDFPPSTDEVYRQIMLNDWCRWNTSLYNTDMCEISEAVYMDLLECLPPRNWKGAYFEVGEPHHDEGNRTIHQACIRIGDKYYTGHPDAIKEKMVKSAPI